MWLQFPRLDWLWIVVEDETIFSRQTSEIKRRFEQLPTEKTNTTKQFLIGQNGDCLGWTVPQRYPSSKFDDFFCF